MQVLLVAENGEEIKQKLLSDDYGGSVASSQYNGNYLDYPDPERNHIHESLKRIPKTGHLLLVWNDHSQVDAQRRGKRTPFTVALSRDEGQTWEKVRTLEDDVNGWYCYTAITFVGNRVILGHCGGDRRQGGLNRTQITYFDFDWLYR